MRSLLLHMRTSLAALTDWWRSRKWPPRGTERWNRVIRKSWPDAGQERSVNPVDFSTQQCLRILMEGQSERLRLLLARIVHAEASGLRAIPPDQWSGPAREAHDVYRERISTHLASVRASLERAAAESARAVSTLSDRV